MRLEKPRPQLKVFAMQLKSFLSLLHVPTGGGLLFQPVISFIRPASVVSPICTLPNVMPTIGLG